MENLHTSSNKKKYFCMTKAFETCLFYILSKWKRHVNTVLKFCPKIAVLWFSVVFLFQPLCSLSSEIKCLWESRVFTIAIGASIFFKPNPVLLSWKCSSQIELLKSLAWKMILRGLDLSRNLLKNDGEKRCKTDWWLRLYFWNAEFACSHSEYKSLLFPQHFFHLVRWHLSSEWFLKF